MKIIKTPFGEIDIDKKAIEFEIENSQTESFLCVKFIGIQSQCENTEYACITWEINQFDKDGNLLDPLFAVQKRQVLTEISGLNRVSDKGILIIRESFPETEEGEKAYQKAYDSGYNEYQFWMGVLRLKTLPETLITAGQILAQYNRFHQP